MTNQDSNGTGFGSRAGLCGLGSFGFGTKTCKHAGCHRRHNVLFGGYCAEHAPEHGLQPIKLNPDTVYQMPEPIAPPAAGCC